MAFSYLSEICQPFYWVTDRRVKHGTAPNWKCCIEQYLNCPNSSICENTLQSYFAVIYIYLTASVSAASIDSSSVSGIWKVVRSMDWELVDTVASGCWVVVIVRGGVVDAKVRRDVVDVVARRVVVDAVASGWWVAVVIGRRVVADVDAGLEVLGAGNGAATTWTSGSSESLSKEIA